MACYGPAKSGKASIWVLSLLFSSDAHQVPEVQSFRDFENTYSSCLVAQ